MDPCNIKCPPVTEEDAIAAQCSPERSDTIDRRLHALNLTITGLEMQYYRLRREYLSRLSDVDCSESCDDDLEVCDREFGSRCGRFRTVPGLGNVVEANRLREDASKVMDFTILRRDFDAKNVLSLSEARIPEYRTFLCDLRARITRLSRALRDRWNTIQLRDLCKVTSDFENCFETLQSRYTALPSAAFDDTISGTPCQPLDLDEEFGEGCLGRGGLGTQLASLRAVANRLETAMDVRRDLGEWADELLQQGFRTAYRVGRRLGELQMTVNAYDEAFRREHLTSERANTSCLGK